jgi:hypothetical protein
MTQSGKRESSIFKYFWMPAFAGMTEFRTFYESVIIQLWKNKHIFAEGDWVCPLSSGERTKKS